MTTFTNNIKSGNQRTDAVYITNNPTINKLYLTLTAVKAGTFAAKEIAFTFHLGIPSDWTVNLEGSGDSSWGNSVSEVKDGQTILSFTPANDKNIDYKEKDSFRFVISNFIIKDKQTELQSYIESKALQSFIHIGNTGIPQPLPPLSVIVQTDKPGISHLIVPTSSTPEGFVEHYQDQDAVVLYNINRDYSQTLSFSIALKEGLNTINQNAIFKFYLPVDEREGTNAICTPSASENIVLCITSNYGTDNFSIKNDNTSQSDACIATIKVEHPITIKPDQKELFTIKLQPIIIAPPETNIYTSKWVGNILVEYQGFDGYLEDHTILVYVKRPKPEMVFTDSGSIDFIALNTFHFIANSVNAWKEPIVLYYSEDKKTWDKVDNSRITVRSDDTGRGTGEVNFLPLDKIKHQIPSYLRIDALCSLNKQHNTTTYVQVISEVNKVILPQLGLLPDQTIPDTLLFDQINTFYFKLDTFGITYKDNYELTFIDVKTVNIYYFEPNKNSWVCFNATGRTNKSISFNPSDTIDLKASGLKKYGKIRLRIELIPMWAKEPISTKELEIFKINPINFSHLIDSTGLLSFDYSAKYIQSGTEQLFYKIDNKWVASNKPNYQPEQNKIFLSDFLETIENIQQIKFKLCIISYLDDKKLELETPYIQSPIPPFSQILGEDSVGVLLRNVKGVKNLWDKDKDLPRKEDEPFPSYYLDEGGYNGFNMAYLRIYPIIGKPFDRKFSRIRFRKNGNNRILQAYDFITSPNANYQFGITNPNDCKLRITNVETGKYSEFKGSVNTVSIEPSGEFIILTMGGKRINGYWYYSNSEAKPIWDNKVVEIGIDDDGNLYALDSNGCKIWESFSM